MSIDLFIISITLHALLRLTWSVFIGALGNATLVDWIRLAGCLHLLIVAANFFLPSQLKLREGLAHLPRILRQVFLVHWVYILIVLLNFSILCIVFAPELAGGSPLGRFLAGSLCLFWLLRAAIQILYYDRQVRRQHRFVDLSFTASLLLLSAVFASAALVGGR